MFDVKRNYLSYNLLSNFLYPQNTAESCYLCTMLFIHYYFTDVIGMCLKSDSLLANITQAI